MQRTAPGHPQALKLGRNILDSRVRRIYEDILSNIESLDEDVRLECNNIEVRAHLDDEMICLVVPYRELVHVKIGEGEVREIRIREDSEYAEAVDMILKRFLELAQSKM